MSYGSTGRQPARRRRSPVGGILVTGAAVVVAVLVGAAVVGIVGRHHTSPPPAVAAPVHTLPPTIDVPTGESDPPSSTDDSGSYRTPERSAIYQTATMPDVHCGITLSTVTIAAYHSYLKSAMHCLNVAWKTVLASRGISFSAPSLVAVDEQPADPCGNQQAGYQPASFYCSANGGTIYVNVPKMVRIYGPAHSDYLEEIPAHEYGHHLQTLYGLWTYYSQRFDPAYPDDVATYTLLSRRMELQAECFAGVFMSHNLMKSSVGGLTNDAVELGDDQVPGWETNPSYRNHGLGRDTVAWFQRGISSGRASSCNTWTAPAASVA